MNIIKQYKNGNMLIEVPCTKTVKIIMHNNTFENDDISIDSGHLTREEINHIWEWLKREYPERF